MLVDQDRVAVRVQEHEGSRAGGGLVGFVHEFQALGFELALQLARVGERFQRLGVLVPAGVEGQDIFCEYALE